MISKDLLRSPNSNRVYGDPGDFNDNSPDQSLSCNMLILEDLWSTLGH